MDDQEARCLDIARTKLASGDFAGAKRFCQKAIGMGESKASYALLEEIERVSALFPFLTSLRDSKTMKLSSCRGSPFLDRTLCSFRLKRLSRPRCFLINHFRPSAQLDRCNDQVSRVRPSNAV